MKKASALSPGNPEPVIGISRLFADIGVRDSALIYLNRAEALAPQHPGVQQLKNSFRDAGFYNNQTAP